MSPQFLRQRVVSSSGTSVLAITLPLGPGPLAPDVVNTAMYDQTLRRMLGTALLIGLIVLVACLNDLAFCHYPPMAAYLPFPPYVLRPPALW